MLGSVSKASFFLLCLSWKAYPSSALFIVEMYGLFELCVCGQKEPKSSAFFTVENVWIIGSFVWPTRAEEVCSNYRG